MSGGKLVAVFLLSVVMMAGLTAGLFYVYKKYGKKEPVNTKDLIDVGVASGGATAIMFGISYAISSIKG